MNDIDELRRRGLLVTDKKYKQLLAGTLLMVILPCVFFLIGMFLAMYAQYAPQYGYEIFIAGTILLIVSLVILLFNLAYAFLQFLPRLRLYQDYKKHPEDFEQI